MDHDVIDALLPWGEVRHGESTGGPARKSMGENARASVLVEWALLDVVIRSAGAEDGDVAGLL